MPVAIDTSILTEAEHAGSIGSLLPSDESGPFYIPALAATEFLIGTHPPVRDALRYRALLIYRGEFEEMVDEFTESDALEMAKLVAELARKGQQMKFFDAAIAASVMVRGDKLLTADGDFDRLGNKITLLKI
jgi:Predicted nucleic acid-binding protein, contains PIN domain